MPSGAVVRTLLAAAAILTLLAVAAWAGQRRLIFLPDTSAPPAAPTVLPGAEDVRLRTSDGYDLGAWFVPGRNPTGPGRGFTVLYASGNGGSRLGRAPLAAELADAGFATLLMDYRGYGGNPGRPSETGLAADARAALQHLRGRDDVDDAQLLYLGESLGCGVVATLAAEAAPAGMLLRSPFTDLAAVGRVHYPFLPTSLLKDRFTVADTITRLAVPVTVVYGTADTIVPPDQSRAVAAAAPHLVEEVALSGVGHNDTPMFGAPVVEALARLTDTVRR